MPRTTRNPRLTCRSSITSDGSSLVVRLEDGREWTITQKGSFLFLAALKDADGKPLEEETFAVRINRQDGSVTIEDYPDVVELAKERRSRRDD